MYKVLLYLVRPFFSQKCYTHGQKKKDCSYELTWQRGDGHIIHSNTEMDPAGEVFVFSLENVRTAREISISELMHSDSTSFYSRPPTSDDLGGDRSVHLHLFVFMGDPLLSGDPSFSLFSDDPLCKSCVLSHHSPMAFRVPAIG